MLDLFFFLLIGASLKYIDQYYDRSRPHPFLSFSGVIVCTFLAAAMMGWLIATHVSAATLLLGIIGGVALAGKLDTPPFLLIAAGSIIPSLILFLQGEPVAAMNVHVGAVLLLMGGAFADEFFDHFRHRSERMSGEVRPFLWLMTLGVVWYFSLSPFLVLSLLLFDGAYLVVGTMLRDVP